MGNNTFDNAQTDREMIDRRRDYENLMENIARIGNRSGLVGEAICRAINANLDECNPYLDDPIEIVGRSIKRSADELAQTRTELSALCGWGLR